MKLTIVIPVYNEKYTIKELIRRVQEVDVGLNKEIIIVDDGSSDGTREILRDKYADHPGIRLCFHEENQGKGAALSTGIRHAQGELVIFQDADLEYDPQDYPRLLEPILKGEADVVYGSRFKGKHRDFIFWHYVGNKMLTLITNLLYQTRLSDMETCYKVFRREVLTGMRIKARRFNVEPEVTAKVLKRKYRLVELPISYYGRAFSEGKKITWRDGLVALWTLIKYRFRD